VGLDIIAYSKAIPLDEPPLWPLGNEDWYEDYIYTSNVIWPYSQSSLKEGQYLDIRGAERVDCLSLSYSGYNIFRNSLAKIGGYSDKDVWAEPESYVDKPFFEIVNFSDCDGIIDTVAVRDRKSVV